MSCNKISFTNITWTKTLTKTVSFEYVPFRLKYQILKDCLNTVFVLSESTSGQHFRQTEPYLGQKGPRNPLKKSISWMLHCHKNISNFITWKPQMLYRWNLPPLCTSIRRIIGRKLRCSLQGVRAPLKISHKIGFLAQFWPVF